MIRFAEAFPDEAIVSALRRQLLRSPFKALLYLNDPLKRDFYAEMCRIERWSTRTLYKKIGSMLFERTETTNPKVFRRIPAPRARRRGPRLPR